MGETTGISWADHTFNPWRGCTKVSDGCKHCYAETLSLRNPGTLGVWGPRGSRSPAAESYWRQLRKWNAAAAKDGVRRRVFCASLADVFEGQDTMPAASRPIVQAARERLWGEIEACPALDFLLLTKRPENAAALVPLSWCVTGWPRNVWMGTSAENQAAADERIPKLLAIPAAIRWVSYEPALGLVAFRPSWVLGYDFDGGRSVTRPRLDWIVVGGESGPHARPFAVAWARSVVEQCLAAGIAPFVKQLGARPFSPVDRITSRGYDGSLGPTPQGSSRFLNDRAGADPAEWPADLRVQEFPKVAP